MATFQLTDIYQITGIGLVPLGKVESGSLRKGMRAAIEGKLVTITRIEANHKELNEANAGENIALSLKWENKPVPQGFFKKMFSSGDTELNKVLQKYKNRTIEFS